MNSPINDSDMDFSVVVPLVGINNLHSGVAVAMPGVPSLLYIHLFDQLISEPIIFNSKGWCSLIQTSPLDVASKKAA